MKRSEAASIPRLAQEVKVGRRVQQLIGELFVIVSHLESLYPGRRFTIDGHSSRQHRRGSGRRAVRIDAASRIDQDPRRR